MPWARLDSNFWRHPKITRLSFAARGLLVTLISYCADNATDGYVPEFALESIGSLHVRGRNWRRTCSELVENGNLERREGAFYVHDFLDYNFSKEQVDARKKRDRERKSRWDSARNPEGVASDSDYPDPTRPDPDTDLGTDSSSALDVSPPSKEQTIEQPSEPEEQGGVPRDEFGRVDLGDIADHLTPTQHHAYQKLAAREPRFRDVSTAFIERLKAQANGLGEKALTDAIVTMAYDTALPSAIKSPAAYLETVFTEKLEQVKATAIQARRHPRPQSPAGGKEGGSE